MALSREYHRVSEMNRIMRDHLDFLCDVEIEEELTEPAALPKRIIRDRMNPQELRPFRGVHSDLWYVQGVLQGSP